jgi:hypothetical protein
LVYRQSFEKLKAPVSKSWGSIEGLGSGLRNSVNFGVPSFSREAFVQGMHHGFGPIQSGLRIQPPA